MRPKPIHARCIGALVLMLAAGLCGGEEPQKQETGAGSYQPPKRRVRRVYNKPIQWNTSVEEAEAPALPEKSGKNDVGIEPDKRFLDAIKPTYTLPPAGSNPAAARPADPKKDKDSSSDLWILESMDVLLGTASNETSTVEGFGWLADEMAAQATEKDTRKNGDEKNKKDPDDPDDPDADLLPGGLLDRNAPGSPSASLFLHGSASGLPARIGKSETPEKPFQPELIFGASSRTVDGAPRAGEGNGRADWDSVSLRTGKTSGSDRDPASGARTEKAAPAPERPPASAVSSVIPVQPPSVIPAYSAEAAVSTSRDLNPAWTTPNGQGADAYGKIGAVFSPSSEFRPPAPSVAPSVPGSDRLLAPSAGAYQPVRPLDSSPLPEPAGNARSGWTRDPVVPVFTPGSIYQPPRFSK